MECNSTVPVLSKAKAEIHVNERVLVHSRSLAWRCRNAFKGGTFLSPFITEHIELSLRGALVRE